MSDNTPLQIWKHLVTEEMLGCVVQQTNLYAQQFIDSHTLRPRSRVHQWRKFLFSIPELLKFLALTIVMGLIDYPRLEDYWLTSWPFATPTFSRVMSRDRFSLVMRFLHLNDNSKYVRKGELGYDAVYKLRPFLDPLLRHFEKMYQPARELSIDESMIGFKGRLSFIQYLPKKPTKWGMKAFVLAESKSGYTLKWRLYTGEKMILYIMVHTCMQKEHAHYYTKFLENTIQWFITNYREG